MRRLLNSIKWDVRFQVKYGLYLAGTILTLVWIGVLYLFNGDGVKLAIPVVMLSDVSTMGLLFVGAILFFERGQGSIRAVITTPLKTGEYIISKVVSLTLFISLFSMILTLAISMIKGLTINWIFLILSVVLIAAEYVLIGFYLSTFFKNFTDFLLPMGLLFGVLNIPIFSMFNIPAIESTKTLLYILPSTGLIKLLQGIYSNQSMMDVLYAIVYNLIIIFVLYRLCLKNFNTKIIGRAGDLDG